MIERRTEAPVIVKIPTQSYMGSEPEFNELPTKPYINDVRLPHLTNWATFGAVDGGDLKITVEFKGGFDDWDQLTNQYDPGFHPPYNIRCEKRDTTSQGTSLHRYDSGFLVIESDLTIMTSPIDNSRIIELFDAILKGAS